MKNEMLIWLSFSISRKFNSGAWHTSLHDKFDRVVSRNKGFVHLKEVVTILSTGKATQSDDFIDSLTPDEISAYKFASITSCDVERSFSMYNNVLENNRRSFTFENLKKHVVVYCNFFNWFSKISFLVTIKVEKNANIAVFV